MVSLCCSRRVLFFLLHSFPGVLHWFCQAFHVIHWYSVLSQCFCFCLYYSRSPCTEPHFVPPSNTKAHMNKHTIFTWKSISMSKQNEKKTTMHSVTFPFYSVHQHLALFLYRMIFYYVYVMDECVILYLGISCRSERTYAIFAVSWVSSDSSTLIVSPN